MNYCIVKIINGSFYTGLLDGRPSFCLFPEKNENIDNARHYNLESGMEVAKLLKIITGEDFQLYHIKSEIIVYMT